MSLPLLVLKSIPMKHFAASQGTSFIDTTTQPQHQETYTGIYMYLNNSKRVLA